jgi:hypothetical protein
MEPGSLSARSDAPRTFTRASRHREQRPRASRPATTPARWLTAFAPTDCGGYGSPRSRGRRSVGPRSPALNGYSFTFQTALDPERGFAISPPVRREVCRQRPPSEIRGRREDRVRAAPAVSCAKCANKNAHEHTGSAEAIRPSLRNGFTAYTALSPVTGLSCHRHRRDTSRQLDASVGASGPHGFAVRVSRCSSFSASASTASRAALMTLRNAPLWLETARVVDLICPTAEAEYFSREGWTAP